VPPVKQTKFLNTLRDCLLCRRGIAAVEFALIVPFIATLYLGSIAAFDAIRAERQVNLAADTLADLISRERDEANDGFRDDMFSTAAALLGRFTNAGTLGIVMTSVINDDGNITVAWSESNGGALNLEDRDLIELSLPTIPEDESVILVTVSTRYAPILVDTIFNMINYSDTVIARPRFLAQIPYR